MKLDKKQNRLRRARRGRSKIRELEAIRLSIHRTPQHIYAQVIGAVNNQVLASASTLEAEVRKGIKNGGNVEAAAIVGARIAEKAKAAGIDTVAVTYQQVIQSNGPEQCGSGNCDNDQVLHWWLPRICLVFVASCQLSSGICRVYCNCAASQLFFETVCQDLVRDMFA